jgi:2-succinyl-5-enolpyruvyl-6-hydroxy-3-cyclohexene-1-carboxylate synthase
MRPANLQTEWARLLLGSLRQAGVRDVVLSPGARSTPFTWAALSDPGLRCRSVLDERAAAFFAVGHAKMTGSPVLLICTSGSAAANYFPAVVEAAESGTPLLVLTADRGLELQHAAAPQTIDQTRLYGGFARAFFELGAPDPSPRMLRAVQRLAAQAVLAAHDPLPGPVHLNARARKPLGPERGEGAEAEALRGQVDSLLARGAPWASPARRAPDPDAVEALAAACRSAKRGLIVCGPMLPHHAPDAADLAALARATGFPIVAEPASQQRFGGEPGEGEAPAAMVDAFAALLGVASFRDAMGPDLVIQVGRPPTATEWGAYLDRWAESPRYLLASADWPDPWSTATHVVRGDPRETVRAVAAALDAGNTAAHADRRDWLDRLLAANAAAWSVIDGEVGGPFSEGAAVRAAVDATPDGGVLCLGNSLPIREVELFVPAAARGITVWSQRGANGIDGLVSGAAGAAVASGRPTTLLLGDVSFAHDVGGLGAARDTLAGESDASLAVVVLNNGGGRIFERLPMAAGLTETGAFDAWLTPPGLDVGSAAAAYGVAFHRVATTDELREALGRHSGTGGVCVVEVMIPPDGTTEHQRRLSRRLEAAITP